MLIDYHLHNHFSPDSEEKTRDIAQTALNREMREICITNHIELHDHSTGKSIFDQKEARQRFLKIREELNAVQADFPTLPIKFGAELEYVEGRMDEIARFVEETPFDFILGSVHIVMDVIIASHLFADQLFANTDEHTSYNAYFDTLEKLVEWGHFDVVAHFDICKKSGVKFYGPFKPERYEEKIRAILKKMSRKSIGIELNTKCLDNKCREIFPHPTILKWALEEGIENFTLSSDAHEKAQVSKHIVQALNVAKEVGIEYISTYSGRVTCKNPIEA